MNTCRISPRPRTRPRAGAPLIEGTRMAQRIPPAVAESADHLRLGLKSYRQRAAPADIVSVSTGESLRR